TIKGMFSAHGEERFRELETETLRSLFAEEPAIIVGGGGIVLRAENVDLLRQLGTVVWLDADQATLRARIQRLDNRPLLRTANPDVTLSELLEARQPIYKSAADLRVDIRKKNAVIHRKFWRARARSLCWHSIPGKADTQKRKALELPAESPVTRGATIITSL